ncbi:MAG: helix-turn-helix domain-containing protein [Pirellulales bacterium]
MSLSELATGVPVAGVAPVPGPVQGAPVLHRIAEVRHQQGMSLRTVSRHTGIEARRLREQEEESSDLRLSDLYRWQDALGVPVADLLVDSHEPLSTPVMERARMVKVMKTVAAIMESAQSVSIRRLAQTLADQLTEIMPELEGVGPWPAIGQRRSLDDYGRAAEHRLNGRMLRDL